MNEKSNEINQGIESVLPKFEIDGQEGRNADMATMEPKPLLANM